jgi:hypothetical protein
MRYFKAKILEQLSHCHLGFSKYTRQAGAAQVRDCVRIALFLTKLATFIPLRYSISLFIRHGKCSLLFVITATELMNTIYATVTSASALTFDKKNYTTKDGYKEKT